MDTPLHALLGTWQGRGEGSFPTMDSFAYEEEIEFSSLGVPAIRYTQHAWLPADRQLLHLEMGLWRAQPDGRLVVTIALPRVTELSEGTIEDGRIHLVSRHVERGTGGAGLIAVARRYELREGSLEYRISMATDGVPELTGHLEGRLQRFQPG